MLKRLATEIPGVMLLEPAAHPDSRGYFLELYHQEKYLEAGISAEFVQDNFSHSVRGVLRGLHYQLRKPQAKLVTALSGEVFDVVVDIRRGSPTFGKWAGAKLSAENKRQLFIPEGFAHGFCVLSEGAEVVYKCSRLYDPQDDRGILWSDPGIGISWPFAPREISTKDAAWPTLEEARRLDLLPR